METLPDLDRESAQPRRATLTDAATVNRILVDAFHDDEMWGAWAFPVPDSRRNYRSAVFGLFIAGAVPSRWVWLAAGNEAAAVWIPPATTALSDTQQQQLQSLLDSSLETAAPRIMNGLDMIGRARPQERHFYLELLGTDPQAAGRGHGQRLLAANLRLIDAQQAPAYLETGDALVPLYQRFGFTVVSVFDLPEGPTVHTMWRHARG
jgi:ribosomal protein S18 acetylase RimI-like enzyme